MGVISSKVENGVLTLFACGRIDSANAATVEAEIESERSANAHESVILDIENLEYISSAGLRVVLRLRKNEPTLKVENASSDVYEVFEITGFSEMLPISKAYRKISVEGCEVIGQGANGKVYRIDPDTIVKVYMNSDALPDIHRERELARRAFVLGIPTAIPYDVVKVGDSYGSVFELLNAQSFAKIIAKEPERLDEIVALYVDLMKKIHSTEVKSEDMPDMREVAIGWAEFMKDYLPSDKAEKLVKLVKDVPVDMHMMHGDYHLKNVMMQNGEVLLIDMDTLCHGHPVFELASVFNAYIGYSEIDNSISESFMGIPHETAIKVWEKTLRLYLGTDDEKRISEVADKAMVVGYTRIIRRTIRRKALESEKGRAEVEFYTKRLLECLDRTESLLF